MIDEELLKVLAKRYRLGDVLTYVPDAEYARDVQDQVKSMSGKHRARGRTDEQIARSAIPGRALEYVLRANVPGLELIPFEEGKYHGADLHDLEHDVKIDCKGQFFGNTTWEAMGEHLQNLFETYRRGEVDYVITGWAWGRPDLFRAQFYQLIPVELIFRGVPEDSSERVDARDWLSFLMGESDVPGKYYFRNRMASDSGKSIRVSFPWQGNKRSVA